jgi:hypothetical protein
LGFVNGLPFILLGAALLAGAGGLWMFQGRLKNISDAINNAFKTIEDAVTVNLLNPNAGLDKATQVLNQVSNVLNQVKTDMKIGKDIVINDVVPVMHASATIIRNDVGNPLESVGNLIIQVGNGIDIDVVGAHPLHGLAQPLKDAGNYLEDIGDKCVDVGNKIDTAANKTHNVAQGMDTVANAVKTVSDDLAAIVPLVNTTLRNGLQSLVNNLAQGRNTINQVLGFVNNQLIVALAAAGILAIATGVALGP